MPVGSGDVEAARRAARLPVEVRREGVRRAQGRAGCGDSDVATGFQPKRAAGVSRARSREPWSRRHWWWVAGDPGSVVAHRCDAGSVARDLRRVGVMAGLSDQEVWDWLEASCQRRGVPVVVTDVAVVQDVVALLGGPRGRGRAQARSASTTPGAWEHQSRQKGSTRFGSMVRDPGSPGAMTAWSMTALTMAACRVRFKVSPRSA